MTQWSPDNISYDLTFFVSTRILYNLHTHIVLTWLLHKRNSSWQNVWIMEIAEPDSSFLAEQAAVRLVEGGFEWQGAWPPRDTPTRPSWLVPNRCPQTCGGIEPISMTVVPGLQHHLYHLRSLLFQSLVHASVLLPLHGQHNICGCFFVCGKYHVS